MSERWSGEQVERHLRSLELFGMRFGLDRMRRMMTVLELNVASLPAVHVLGTNGKSSTTRMTAAILRRHGLRVGAYLSPHLRSYAERIQIEESDITEAELAAAVTRAAWAAERVNRTLAEDDHVTQFELLTAAGLWVMSSRAVDVAVVEAGLGGRYDATSVIEAPVAVLTNVGLEHTRWLGPTVGHIATEKLAAVRDGAELVLGAATEETVQQIAREIARERSITVSIAPSEPRYGKVLAAAAGFQRENFALAELAAERWLGAVGLQLRPEAAREAAARTTVPGRAQIFCEDPLTILDGAHNPHAAEALARSLRTLFRGRRTALVMGVLEDKDAARMLSILLPHSERAFFTAPPGDRALPPAALQSHARQLGFEAVECHSKPAAALQAAQQWARREGAGVLLTGSVYLIGEVMGQAQPRRARSEQVGG